MTASNHALTGAVIALTIKQPALALPLAFLSHFVLDALPHFGWDSDIFKRNQSKLFWTVLVVDILLLFTSFILITLETQIISRATIIISMVLAISPDFAWVYRWFQEIKTRQHAPGNFTSKFHSRIQWCERPWGIVVEVAWFGALLTVLYKLIWKLRIVNNPSTSSGWISDEDN